jgi:hypothetical protein
MWLKFYNGTEFRYALGEQRFRDRLVTVVAGPPEKLPEDEIPWILRRFKFIKLADNGKKDEIAQALLAAA